MSMTIGDIFVCPCKYKLIFETDTGYFNVVKVSLLESGLHCQLATLEIKLKIHYNFMQSSQAETNLNNI